MGKFSWLGDAITGIQKTFRKADPTVFRRGAKEIVDRKKLATEAVEKGISKVKRLDDVARLPSKVSDTDRIMQSTARLSGDTGGFQRIARDLPKRKISFTERIPKSIKTAGKVGGATALAGGGIYALGRGIGSGTERLTEAGGRGWRGLTGEETPSDFLQNLSSMGYTPEQASALTGGYLGAGVEPASMAVTPEGELLRASGGVPLERGSMISGGDKGGTNWLLWGAIAGGGYLAYKHFKKGKKGKKVKIQTPIKVIKNKVKGHKLKTKK